MHRLFGKKKEVGPAPTLGTLNPYIDENIDLVLSVSSEVLSDNIDKDYYSSLILPVSNTLLMYLWQYNIAN